MSEKEKEKTPDTRGLLHPGQTTDKKFTAVQEILTINENLGAKTTVHSALAMTFIDVLPRWDTAQSMEDLWSPTEKGKANSFGDRYRVNAMATEGKQIDRYVDALKNYLPEVPGMYDRDKKQLTEGNKK